MKDNCSSLDPVLDEALSKRNDGDRKAASSRAVSGVVGSERKKQKKEWVCDWCFGWEVESGRSG